MTTDQIRIEFEKRRPVPEGVVWNGDRYTFDSARDISIALHHEILWNGFQAGYEAAKEERLARLKCKRCVWTCDEYEDAWDTGCGNLFSFIDGSPEENKFKFCCYCGGNLTENREK